MRLSVIIALFFALCMVSNNASALTTLTPLTNEYNISSSATQWDSTHWRYSINITNNTQSTALHTGLDGFFIELPLTTVITGFQAPPSYNIGGFWGVGTGVYGTPIGVPALSNMWLYWWGFNPESVYYKGSTANFVFDILSSENKSPFGSFSSVLVTYWAGTPPASGQYELTPAGYYSSYSTTIIPDTNSGNVNPVPEPSTLLFMGSGLAGLGLVWRKKSRQAK